MSKKAKSEVTDNSADTVMDGVLSENQAKPVSYTHLSAKPERHSCKAHHG